jgi:hypothetical protein
VVGADRVRAGERGEVALAEAPGGEALLQLGEAGGGAADATPSLRPRRTV